MASPQSIIDSGTRISRRRLPVGAEVFEGGVHFRVWAPRASRVDVVTDTGLAPLAREDGGYFAGLVRELAAGARYRFALDGGPAVPDPASRSQPEGPHGPSQVVDPAAFAWSDEGWPGVRLPGQVIYELHVGTFTPAGTWASAIDQLPELARAGITLIEMMPVAEFPGRFGWGYDGVDLFAPSRLYGSPDDLRTFVDRAHGLGLGVILDVVYNHLGPDGNYLKTYAADYFTDRYPNEWGEPINFDGDNAGPVREFFLANAAYWIDEFHVDGLRLDATQTIHDASPRHIVDEIVARARAAARGRHVLIIAENEPQQARLARAPERGGAGVDALWNDDFHHAARVAVTGHNEAYYTDYTGRPQELISAVKYGFLFQGQRYRWQRKRRGTPGRDLAAAAFVAYLQNHDQVANSARGQRLHQLTTPGRFRAITALLLLAPQTPLLFQGQEYCADNPFLYFADHGGHLAQLVRRGRAEFLTQFPSIATAEIRSGLPRPDDEETFARCKLDPSERAAHAEAYALHCDLLRLRRSERVFACQDRHAIDGAVLGEEAFVLRFFAAPDAVTEHDRLLIVNFGRDLVLDRAPEPLLAPVDDGPWRVRWSSESPRYGGSGTVPLEADDGWRLPGHAAAVLAPHG